MTKDHFEEPLPVDHEGGDPIDVILQALANPLRRNILQRLAIKEQTVGDLVAHTDVSMPAISRHLRILEEAGLVIRIQEGRHHLCRLVVEPLHRIDGWIDTFRSAWELHPDRLSDYAKTLSGRI